MKPFIPGLALIAAAFAVQLAATTTSAATVHVNVDDNFYQPATMEITVGDTVQWDFVGSNPHSVTSETAGLFDSGIQTGGVFSHTFNSAGTFAYVCLVHGPSMSGTIVVTAAQPTNTPPPSATNTSVPSATTPAATATTAAPTPTEQAAVTATPVVMDAATVTSTPSAEAVIVMTPTQPSGQPAGAAQLPASGSGPSAGSSGLSWLAAALAGIGVTLVAGAGVRRFVAKRA